MEFDKNALSEYYDKPGSIFKIESSSKPDDWNRLSGKFKVIEEIKIKSILDDIKKLPNVSIISYDDYHDFIAKHVPKSSPPKN